MGNNNTNSIIGIVGAVIFAICTVIIPSLKILGIFLSFIEYSDEN